MPETPSTSRISTRLSIRWFPDPAFENTDTIVMSVNGWYVDLRMDKKTNKIDWAIAGQRLIDSKDPSQVLFTHELDSQDAFSAVDSGAFTSLPNGDDLETGQMPRHDLPGAPMTDYEEIWRELTPREGPEGKNRGVSWILESVGEDFGDREGEIKVVKTFLGRIWGTYVALRQVQTHTRQKTPSGEWKVSKTGADVSARREEWEPSFGWKAKYVIGKDGNTLPSMNDGFGNKGKVQRSSGEKIVIGGETYLVRSFEEIDTAGKSKL